MNSEKYPGTAAAKSQCPHPDCPCETCQWLRDRAIQQAKDGVTAEGMSPAAVRFLNWAKRNFETSREAITKKLWHARNT
jgi:hypothetical protein